MRTRRESGYSLVEVMAAIVILTTAIIPMVGMFDAALRAVSTSGDYGVARACAGQKLEQLRSLPYETVSAGLPDGTCEPSGLSYAFHEEFVSAELQGIQEDQGLTRVTVTVSWDGGDSYATTGVVSRW
ncbi:MAG TPA: type II secretion system protein [Rubrobacteraceae bacterium]|nr:type II secretion system protein [Rubrobacteraceae bacterium]